MFEVTLIGTLLAGIAGMAIGMVWYNPKVFGTAWMRAANLSPEAAELGKKKMPLHALIGLLTMVVMAYVIAHFGIAWGVYDWIGAVELAFWVWAGFQVPVAIGPVLWEMKPWKLFLINAAYQLVALVVMALILVSF